MFEHRTSPLLPRQEFIRRMWRCALLAAGIATATLAVGMIGYHFLEGMNWVDAFANASMILAGMGEHVGGQIFRGLLRVVLRADFRFGGHDFNRAGFPSRAA
jgi:hypothetical protein